MKFHIRRTSLWSGKANESPCADAAELGGKWFIDVDSLADLIALVVREGDIIVSVEDGIGKLEIYDERRE